MRRKVTLVATEHSKKRAHQATLRVEITLDAPDLTTYEANRMVLTLADHVAAQIGHLPYVEMHPSMVTTKLGSR